MTGYELFPVIHFTQLFVFSTRFTCTCFSKFVLRDLKKQH